MIQRIQTLYLLIAGAVAVILLTVNIPYYEFLSNANGENKLLSLGFSEIRTLQGDKLVSAEENQVMTYVLVAIAALSFFAIIMFRNRQWQKALCLIDLLAVAALYVLVFASIFSHHVPTQDKGISWGIFIIIIFPFVIIAAFSGIKRDEALLRSLNSIR